MSMARRGGELSKQTSKGGCGVAVLSAFYAGFRVLALECFVDLGFSAFRVE